MKRGADDTYLMSTAWRVLFVLDKKPASETLVSALKETNPEWTVETAESGKAAIAALKESRYEVVFSDLALADQNGVDFLNQVWRDHPRAVRFLFASEADWTSVVNAVLGTHQVVHKEAEPEKIRELIDRVLSVDNLIQNQTLKELVSRMRTFPSLPSSYFEVMKELGSPDASADRVGELIAKDLAMTTKMIQMVNSAFFGMQRQITDPTEAVMVLGMETVRSLVLSIQAFSQFDKVKPIYFSIDKVWKHSMAVAKIAREIVMFETKDPNMANEAYTAGLLHDVGKLILATNLDDQYSGALKLAKSKSIPAWEVEHEVFSASHAEVGGYLLSHWGLPVAIVEATALHHNPGNSPSTEFTPLTAVHVANVLESENLKEPNGFVQPVIDEAYLERIGMGMRLDIWREVAKGKSPSSDSEAETEAPAKPVPANVVPIETAKSIPSPQRKSVPAWLAPAGIAAAIIVSVGLGIAMFPTPKPQPVSAEESAEPHDRGCRRG